MCDFTISEWFMHNFYIGSHLVDNFMTKHFLSAVIGMRFLTTKIELQLTESKGCDGEG